jgi:protein TonB
MANFHATDPVQGTQGGKKLGESHPTQGLPVGSPLFQVSWIQEIFRYRNQSYGAYVLRQQYSRRMLQGGLIAIGFAGVLCGASLLASAFPKDKAVAYAGIVDLVDMPPPDEPVAPPPPPPVTPPPPVAPSLTFIAPKAVEDNLVKDEVDPPTQEALVNSNPGTITTKGDPGGVDIDDDPILVEGPPEAVLKDDGDSKPKEPEIFIIVQQMPAFRGNLNQYLAQEMRYPDIAKENGIEGTVVIRFIVNEKGEISDPVIVKDIGGGCGEEALRVVRAMPAWLPGANRGIPVKVQMNLPVKFKLE